ncbi:hypothetical protein GCM10009544_19440 [Streptomyces stramineus]|uniref:Large integral membrane protein n=1 Tax=Streptomyces stramineus TaxID=173861 RepID=A0ABP3JKR5_9ACTN
MLSPVLSAALLGLVLACAAAYLLFVTVPGKFAGGRALATSSVCVEGEPSTDCRRALEAAVTKVETEGKHYWLTLTERGGTVHRVDMSGPASVYGAVAVGNKVTATTWRGKIRYLDFHGMRQDTDDQPKDSYRFPFGTGMALLCLSATLFVCAAWWARRPSDNPALRPWQIAVPTVTGTLVAVLAFLAPLVTETASTAVVLTSFCAVPVLAGALLWIRVRRRRPIDTLEITPLVPEREMCFEGFAVRGEGPYLPGADGFLVVGPGRLAVTPDPDGRAARTQAPATLVADRVRVPSWRDPAAVRTWRSGPGVTLRQKRAQVVVECRDGDAQVLITADKRNAPWILGALGPAGPGVGR